MKHANWATINFQRKARARGTEDATGTKEDAHPGASLLERATAGRNTKLRLYLETGSHKPRTEEELSRALARLQAQRAEKEAWLRGVLDACED